MSILVSINPSFRGVVMSRDAVFTIKNCTFDGVYRHGTIKNGKRQVSNWTKRFVARTKYGVGL